MTRKVIFDTNLWSDIGDEGSLADLRRAVEELDCLVVLPPSILVELMRNPHSESRKRHIAAIVGIRGRRLVS
jgi:predicted nucleic acid-binding protein